MKYCGCGYGCGCQNSCGYPRMRIRMRSSDTPLVIRSKQYKIDNRAAVNSLHTISINHFYDYQTNEVIITTSLTDVTGHLFRFTFIVLTRTMSPGFRKGLSKCHFLLGKSCAKYLLKYSRIQRCQKQSARCWTQR